MKNKQFYFIEDQDYANEELKEYKQYLYEKGFIVNNLIIAKDIKNKDEALLKLIDCNLTETKGDNLLYVVCGGPLSMYLLNELNYLSFDGMITFECANLTCPNLKDFKHLTKHAKRNIDKENWKSYFSVVPQSLNYIKNYFGAHYHLRKGNNILKLCQINKDKDIYKLTSFYIDKSRQDKKEINKTRINNIKDLDSLFENINSIL